MNHPTSITPTPQPMPGWVPAVLTYLDAAGKALPGAAAIETRLIHTAITLITAREDLDSPHPIDGLTGRQVVACRLTGAIEDLTALQERTVGEDVARTPLPDWARTVLTRLDAAHIAAAGGMTDAERRIVTAAGWLLASKYAPCPGRDATYTRGGWVARELVIATIRFALEEVEGASVPASGEGGGDDAPGYPAPGGVIPGRPGYRAVDVADAVDGLAVREPDADRADRARQRRANTVLQALLGVPLPVVVTWRMSLVGTTLGEPITLQGQVSRTSVRADVSRWAEYLDAEVIEEDRGADTCVSVTAVHGGVQVEIWGYVDKDDKPAVDADDDDLAADDGDLGDVDERPGGDRA